MTEKMKFITPKSSPANKQFIGRLKDIRGDKPVAWESSPGIAMAIKRVAGAAGAATKGPITILFNGTPIETIFDPHGTQRFRKNYNNPYLSRMVTIAGNPNNPEGDIKDLNQLCMMFVRGQIPVQDYIQVNMDLGYSVAGFCEVMDSHEIPCDIKNPIWEEGNNP